MSRMPLRALCGAVLLLSGMTLHAQGKPSEDQVKAAYLLNFGKFVRHVPSEAQTGTFDICFLGKDSVAPMLERIAHGEQVNDHPVRVLTLENAAAAKTCAIVFIGVTESSHMEADLAALRGSDVLTVSDQPSFMKRGGMLEFMLQNSRVRFGINLDAVNHANLQLSSELLKVAASVSGTSRREVGQ